MHAAHTHYDLGFVILSILVAVLSAFVALDMVRSVSRARGTSKKIWYGSGAFAMGTGIWSMHFIGMLAHEASGIAVSYDLFLMVVSIIVSVVTSGFALYLLSHAGTSRRRLTLSALAMSFGIGSMHYIGMVSMRMQAYIHWNWWLVAVSFVVAITLSYSAFIVMYRFAGRAPALVLQLVSSVLLGSAVVGLHYVGMEAAEYEPATIVFDASSTIIASSSLVTLTIFSTFFVLLLALISALVERTFAAQDLREREHVAQVREAQLANELKTQFLATMSHEIRTPLASIIGFTELMLAKTGVEAGETMNEERQTEYLQTIDRCARTLSQLIDDILDLSRIELGHLELDMQVVRLKTVLDEVLTILRIKAESKGIELRFSDGAGVPEYIHTDGARLRQVLVNLIGNAIKFTSRGFISLTIEVDEENEQLLFFVKDTGVGIEEQKQAALFQPFSQGDSSMTRIYGGTGLGLDISRRLARAMGGDVELVQSRPGEGSTFLAKIVLYVASAPSALPDDSVSQDVQPGCSVLLVDDNIDNQVFIAHLLRSKGVHVEVANNGHEGVERAMATIFDVVLMDLQMPVMNGYEATAKLRTGGYRIPIVALTAHATKQDKDLCLSSGFSAYLTKPLDTDLLFRTLNEFSSAARK